MYSTINNISSNIIICSCGSKTTDMINHLKSRKHLILQRIKDKENIIFGTITETEQEILIKKQLYKDASTQTNGKTNLKKRGRKTKTKLLEPEPEPELDETIKTENIEINYTPEFIINFDSEN
jgi:hypothetical protein